MPKSRARHDGLEREARARAERLKAIAAEQAQWTARAQRAGEQIESLSRRAEETRATIVELAALPQQLADRRLKLMNTLAEAEQARKVASDALAEAENAVRAADQDLRAAQEQASASREEHARLGARLEASQQRLEACERRVAETLNCAPAEVPDPCGPRSRAHRARRGDREEAARPARRPRAPRRRQSPRRRGSRRGGEAA